MNNKTAIQFVTTREISARWGLSTRRINILCKTGRIAGAYMEGKQWYIPADAKKPADKRYKGELQDRIKDANQNFGKTDYLKTFETGQLYLEEDSHIECMKLSKERLKRYAALIEKVPNKKLPLPIGVSDYRKASSEYYYVDKTLLIRDFLDERPQVSLFTRPRRFGKTLNMDMLRVFFEKTDEDTSVYFRDKLIWACGEEYQKYQGKYPVIYVTFKDIKSEDWESAYGLICQILRNEFERHGELTDSSVISSYDKAYLTRMLSGVADEADVSFAPLNLSRMLHKHHGVAPVIIIDEYDTPIQQGYVRGYYEQMIDFMRALFSGGLKDNPHLSFGFLTGILRVAKESIFSGLNNLKVNSILDARYGQYFGFTSEEVKEMAEYYEVPGKCDEISEWYDGYRFGKAEIFNPWSVIGYFNNECKPKAFWQSTGSHDIIGEVLENADTDIYENLEALLKGQTVHTHIDTSVIYPQIRKVPSSIYSFLLVTGYLKVVKSDATFGGDYMCEVALPNKEIAYVYSREILSKFDKIIPPSAAIAIQEAIYTKNIPALQQKLETFLKQTISYYDGAGEIFYHGLVLGLCAMLDNRYRVTSNREVGKGRYDIGLFPLENEMPGIIIEIKAGKNCTEAQLNAKAREAIEQIEEKQYCADMQAAGVKEILKYGIAFSGKNACVKVE